MNSLQKIQPETSNLPRKTSGTASNFERVVQEFARQQANFEVILACMTQGIALFGPDERLVFCNRRYMEIHGLSEDLARPGLHIVDILKYRIRSGSYPDVSPEQYIAKSLAIINSGRQQKNVHQLRNGATISHGYIPLEGGGWISTHEDVSEIYTLQQEVQHMAFHDQLTGLPNRRMLVQHLAEVNDLCSPENGFALLFLDLDGFKPVNDSYGHSAGDELLCMVTERLKSRVRREDLIARLGGDEFAVVQCSATCTGDAKILAQRIIDALDYPFDVAGTKIRVSTSIGIVYTDARADDSDALLISADSAMYEAKRAGGNRYHVGKLPPAKHSAA